MLVSGTDNQFADLGSPALVAATYYITRGFITMIMLGGIQHHPEWLVNGLTATIFIVLLLNSLSILLESKPHRVVIVAQSLFWLCAGCFAVATLWLQSKRCRGIADATLSFFRLGMMALLCAAPSTLAALFFPAIDRLRTESARLFLLGFAMSLMHGMLYKIAPFFDVISSIPWRGKRWSSQS